MTLREELFGFHGRIRRTDWWVKGILTGIVALAVIVPLRLMVVVGAEPGPFQGETGFWLYQAIELLLMAPFLWVQTALSVKRAHDLNIPAWPILVFQVFAVGSGYIPFDQLPSNIGPVTLVQAAFVVNGLYLLGCLAELVVLGFFPGRQSANRFGPSPYAEKPVFTAPGGLE